MNKHNTRTYINNSQTVPVTSSALCQMPEAYKALKVFIIYLGRQSACILPVQSFQSGSFKLWYKVRWGQESMFRLGRSSASCWPHFRFSHLFISGGLGMGSQNHTNSHSMHSRESRCLSLIMSHQWFSHGLLFSLIMYQCWICPKWVKKEKIPNPVDPSSIHIRRFKI